MTRRRILFKDKSSNKYYVSDEYNGDKVELERIGSADSCDLTWDEIMGVVRSTPPSLWGFMQLMTKLDGCYHSCLGRQLPGVILRSVESLNEVEWGDEVYLIDGETGQVALLDQPE